MPCEVHHMKTTECLIEGKVMDGKFDCRNRADEEAFQNRGNLLLDLKQILKPCNDLRTHRRGHGFKCSEVNLYRNCLQMASWCAHFPICTCSELNGTTATGKTINPQLCYNQTFWEHTAYNFTNYNRCTGRHGICHKWHLNEIFFGHG